MNMVKQLKFQKKGNSVVSYKHRRLKNEWANQPVYQKRFCKNLVAIYKIKPALTLDTQIYVGFSILDLSKF